MCLCVCVHVYLYLLVCITVTKRNSAWVAFSLRQRLIDSSFCVPWHPFSALGSRLTALSSLGSIIYIFMAWEDLCAPSFRRCASCSRSSAKICSYFFHFLDSNWARSFSHFSFFIYLLQQDFQHLHNFSVPFLSHSLPLHRTQILTLSIAVCTLN